MLGNKLSLSAEILSAGLDSKGSVTAASLPMTGSSKKESVKLKGKY